ncbi:MAG TPA: tetratricopeptide repeat protein, partial [Anaerolineales bacterium]
LQSASQIKLLVTTREALNLQGETCFDVQGLEFPESDDAEGTGAFDAVTLFVQRARRATPQFALNAESHLEIAHICRLVEGMPLAIELAATWMRVLSPAEIAREIEGSLDFLSTSVRDLPERHRSMRVVFDHSWQMLSRDDQQVLGKLSVFRGGFQRKAAEQVAGATLSKLSTLVNRTLLRRTTSGRYDLHELVLQYCAGQLEKDLQVKKETEDRHFAYYLSLARTSDQELRGPNQLEWLERLEQEHDNLRKALDSALECDGSGEDADERAVKLAAALRWFWRMHGHFREGCDWLTEALQCRPALRSQARAGALLAASLLTNGLGDLSAALVPAEEAMSIYEELDDEAGLAEARLVAGVTNLWQGEAAKGYARLLDALASYQKIGDRWGEAQALYRLGSYTSDYSGDLAGRELLKKSAAILEGLGEKYLNTSVLTALGIIDLSRGDYDSAQTFLERSLATTREIKHPWGIADSLTNLGGLYRIRGNYSAAQTFFEEALDVYQKPASSVWQTDVYCAMAENASV